MIVNQLHTPIENLEVSKEIYNDIIEYLSSVKFLQTLTSPDRKYAKDKPRDKKGRIVVDVTEPHILEDMDYFRQTAIHFEKFGTYTDLYPNSNPNSEYYKFWQEEARRCREGYVRKSDGEWITNYHYFYLNYSPILKVDSSRKEEKASRIEGFPNIYDMDYLYFHYLDQASIEGKHCGVLKVRGSGYSFKGASSLAKVFKLGDTTASKTKQTAFAIADESEYLIKDGIFNKFENIVSFLDQYTPWPKIRLTSTINKMKWVMGYKDSEGKDKGTLNSVQGVTLKNDPQRARGKRSSLILWEEFGDFMDGLTSWQIARPSVEDGDFAFGTMVAYGTGGVIGEGFRALEELFYHSKAYNVKELPNVWDKNTSDTSKSAIFIPGYMNRTGCYDKNGNSDVTKALAQILIKWYTIRDNTSDAHIFQQAKAEIPIVPQDAMLRKGGNLFPVGELKEVLSSILVDPIKFTAPHYTGELTYGTDGELKWKNSFEKKPIHDFPIRDNINKEGAIEIFQHPIKNAEGNIVRYRYIAGIDPYDDDSSTTNSLGSIFIFDRFTDQIVAEYTGRPDTANEFYEICLRLLKYYNAVANYENDKKGLFGYFSNRNALGYLCDTPNILKDMDMIKGDNLFGNKSKGSNSSKAINAYGRSLQRDWMLEEGYGSGAITLNSEGIEVEGEKFLNLHRIKSIPYIKEAIGWNIDGNFDRVSSMGMLMILKEDLAKYEVKNLETKSKTVAQDPFFQRHSKIGYRENKKFNNYLEFRSR